MTVQQLFDSKKPVKLVLHPLFDNFGKKISKAVARENLNINIGEKIILFFGFIRKYKGLDILLDALAIIKALSHTAIPFKLLIAGEFYEDRKDFDERVKKAG